MWVNGNGLEPVWPRFPSQEPRLRPGIRIVRDTSQSKDTVSYQIPTPNEYVDHSSVARWLASAGSLFHVTARPWLRRLAAAYADWTAVANGSALQQHESVDTTMLDDWNEAYYRLLAHCLPGMQPDEVDKFALNPIKSLPDEVVLQCDRTIPAPRRHGLLWRARSAGSGGSSHSVRTRRPADAKL